MDYKERLKQYLEEDVIYSEYKSGRCDMSDFDKFCIEHCKDIECLLNEVQELKEQLEVGKEQYNDLVEEKENLQEQLDYLRGGEYLNQLRFERDMLQHVVDTNGVPSEVYDYLDCTHRNTELLEESQELKKQLDELQAVYSNMFKCHCNRVQVETLLSQQKEFIEWLEDYIDTLKTESDSVEGLGICEYYTLLALEEVLSKYKETIGVKDEKVNC